MSGVLCYLAGSEDRAWFELWWRETGRARGARVVALSLQARRLAEELGVPHEAYDALSWALDKPALYDRARRLAWWYESPEVRGLPALEALREFDGYPLLAMHQPQLILVLYDILQAWTLMDRILDLERPEEVVLGRRELDLAGNWQVPLTGERGQEMEVLSSMARQRGLAVREFPWPVPPAPPAPPPAGPARRLARRLRGMLRRALRPGTAAHGPADVLVRVWGDYYLEQLSGTLDLLAAEGWTIHVMTCGGPVNAEQAAWLASRGISRSEEGRWPGGMAPGEAERWAGMGRAACAALDDAPGARRVFAVGSETFFDVLRPFLHRELAMNLPRTVATLRRSEGVLDALAPRLVLDHMALHPAEVAKVLPARRRGVTTLTVNHGTPGVVGTERHTFATEYNAVVGRAYRDMLVESMGADPDKLFEIGDQRVDALRRMEPAPDAKRREGFDPARSVCVFCDMSGWLQNVAWRHSTYDTVAAVTALAASEPGVQFVYRVHGGTDHTDLRRAVRAMAPPNLAFEEAHEREFGALLEAADVMISHNSSAIVEGLAAGVPVLYLFARAFFEPSYVASRYLVFVDDHERLGPELGALLAAAPDREAVRRDAQPFFEQRICGADGKAGERLAQVVRRLAALPQDEARAGFDDWLDRLRASGGYVSKVYQPPGTGGTAGEGQ